MCHLNRALGSIGGAAAAVADVNLTELYNGDLIRGAVPLRFQVRTEQEKQQHALTLVSYSEVFYSEIHFSEDLWSVDFYSEIVFAEVFYSEILFSEDFYSEIVLSKYLYSEIIFSEDF